MATAGVLTVVLFIFCGIEKTLPVRNIINSFPFARLIRKLKPD